MTERRRFSRIIYRAPALVTYNGHMVATTVQDLSLHGILLSLIDDEEFVQGDEVKVDLPLPESDIVIHVDAHVVDADSSSIRVRISHIDIDSITHLRRLVELNVGNDSLLHRELEHLTDLADQIEED